VLKLPVLVSVPRLDDAIEAKGPDKKKSYAGV
jgi:hypothetical protein